MAEAAAAAAATAARVAAGKTKLAEFKVKAHPFPEKERLQRDGSNYAVWTSSANFYVRRYFGPYFSAFWGEGGNVGVPLASFDQDQLETARMTMLEMQSPELRPSFEGLASASDMVRAVNEKFASKTVVRQLVAQRTLEGLTPTDKEDPITFFMRVETARREYELVGGEVKEEQLVQRYMQEFMKSDKYRMAVHSYSTQLSVAMQPSTLKGFEQVIVNANALMPDPPKTMRGPGVNAVGAYGNDYGGGCWHCGDKGHIRANCPVLAEECANMDGAAMASGSGSWNGGGARGWRGGRGGGRWGRGGGRWGRGQQHWQAAGQRTVAQGAVQQGGRGAAGPAGGGRGEGPPMDRMGRQMALAAYQPPEGGEQEEQVEAEHPRNWVFVTFVSTEALELIRRKTEQGHMIVDSGSATHVWPYVAAFIGGLSGIFAGRVPEAVNSMSGNDEQQVAGSGDILLSNATFLAGHNSLLRLNEVACIPGSVVGIISVAKVTRGGNHVIVDQHRAMVYDAEMNPLLTATREGGHYWTEGTVATPTSRLGAGYMDGTRELRAELGPWRIKEDVPRTQFADRRITFALNQAQILGLEAVPERELRGAAAAAQGERSLPPTPMREDARMEEERHQGDIRRTVRHEAVVEAEDAMRQARYHARNVPHDREYELRRRQGVYPYSLGAAAAGEEDEGEADGQRSPGAAGAAASSHRGGDSEAAPASVAQQYNNGDGAQAQVNSLQLVGLQHNAGDPFVNLPGNALVLPVYTANERNAYLDEGQPMAFELWVHEYRRRV